MRNFHRFEIGYTRSGAKRVANCKIWNSNLNMEFLIVFAMAVIIMLFLGFGVGDIIMLAMYFIAVLVMLTGVFFVVNLVFLLSSKRNRGEFTRINDEGRFPRAVYKTDGGEFSNLFPCEMIMRDKLYVPEKTVTLYFSKFLRLVIDKNALITIIAGSVIFIPLGAAAAMFLIDGLSAFF